MVAQKKIYSSSSSSIKVYWIHKWMKYWPTRDWAKVVVWNMQSWSRSSSWKHSRSLKQMAGLEEGVGKQSVVPQRDWEEELPLGAGSSSTAQPPPFPEVPPALPGFCVFSSRKHQISWKPRFCFAVCEPISWRHSHHRQPAVLFLTPRRQTRLGFQQVKPLG